MFIHADFVTPSGLVQSARLEIVDGLIAGFTDEPGDGIDLSGHTVVPGFVDMHCHGGGTFDMTVTPAESADFHLQHGTTTILGSLVTASAEQLLAQIRMLRGLAADGVIAGIHLEGPWLSAHQCGAHDEDLLRPPTPDEIAALVRTGEGTIRMATLAPELPGAIEAIALLTDAGVVAAVGHTDCDYDTAVAAIDAGATVATHLFNRMPHLGKRHPGPVLALLEAPEVTLELIPDGVHVDTNLMRFVVNTVGPERIAGVTDAMAAAGAGDGHYTLGELDVDVVDGVARLSDDGALAGSTLTMDSALRTLVADCGLGLVEVSRMLSGTPAQAMGFSDRGAIERGMRADLVVLTPDLDVVAVMRTGEWVVTP